jgi:hypothetical protein
LTGSPVFVGDTITEIIGRVVTAEQDWNRLPANTPVSIRRSLDRMLKKNSRERLGDIRDARLDIEDALKELESPTADAKSGREARLAWVTAALAITLAAALVPAALYFRRSPAAASEIRFEISVPQMVDNYQFSVSPYRIHRVKFGGQKCIMDTRARLPNAPAVACYRCCKCCAAVLVGG